MNWYLFEKKEIFRMWKIVQFVNELTQNPMNRVLFFFFSKSVDLWRLQETATMNLYLWK